VIARMTTTWFWIHTSVIWFLYCNTKKYLFYPEFEIQLSLKVWILIEFMVSKIIQNTTTYCAFLRRAKPKIWRFCERKKKREGFAKEKKLATFAMPSASQLVAQQSSQIYNEPLIIVALLRDSRQTKLCDPLNACPS